MGVNFETSLLCPNLKEQTKDQSVEISLENQSCLEQKRCYMTKKETEFVHLLAAI